MILAAAGWAEAEGDLSLANLAFFGVMLATWILIAVLLTITLQTVLQLLVSRPQWSLKQQQLFAVGIAVTTWLCTIVY